MTWAAFRLSGWPTTSCAECAAWIFDSKTGERERPRTKFEPTPCNVCVKQSPAFVPLALTLWAWDVYWLLDPTGSGVLSAGTLTAWPPQEADALVTMQCEVKKWRTAKSA